MQWPSTEIRSAATRYNGMLRILVAMPLVGDPHAWLDSLVELQRVCVHCNEVVAMLTEKKERS